MTLDRLDTVIAFAALMLGVSLMITILTQMMGTLLGHRGTYLKAGLKQLLETVDPRLEGEAENLARSVLTHPIISDSIFVNRTSAPLRWRLASAVRPEELSRLLKLCTEGKLTESIVDDVLKQVNPELAREAEVLAKTVNDSVPALKVSTDQLVKQVADKAGRAVGKLEAWFNSTMDRVSQRFALQMHIWTVVFAVLVTVLAHLDSFRLYSELSSDPHLRSGLVGATDTLLKKAADSLPSGQVDNQLKQTTDKLADQYKTVDQVLRKVGFQLFPDPYPWFDFSNDSFLGLLAAAALLSLGAPFWFNALKTLSNLRPILANKAEPAESK